jgi:hypothetical protein
MKKLEFIKKYASQTDGWNKRSLIPALVSCLSIEETIQALEGSQIEDQYIRRAILNKINKDILIGKYQSYYIKLINKLISSFSSLPSNKKQTFGYILNTLYYLSPPETQQKIINFFLTSKYIHLRNRAYKILSKKWAREYKLKIIKLWKKHHDYYCAILILQHIENGVILKNFNSLEKILRGKQGYPNLYIKLGSENPNIIKNLKEQDGITYTYVTYKLGSMGDFPKSKIR